MGPFWKIVITCGHLRSIKNGHQHQELDPVEHNLAPLSSFFIEEEKKRMYLNAEFLLIFSINPNVDYENWL